MKRFSDKVEVKVDGRSRPVALSLGGVRSPRVNYRVSRILGWWREPGRWWEGEPVALYLRLLAVPRYTGEKKAGKAPEALAGPRIFELCRVGEEWYFHRLLA